MGHCKFRPHQGHIVYISTDQKLERTHFQPIVVLFYKVMGNFAKEQTSQRLILLFDYDQREAKFIIKKR